MVEKGELRSKDEKVRWRAGERPRKGTGRDDDHGGARDGAPNPTKTSYIPRNGQFATARLRVIWWFFFSSPSLYASLSFCIYVSWEGPAGARKEDPPPPPKIIRNKKSRQYKTLSGPGYHLTTNERTSEWNEMRLRVFGHNTTPMYLRDDYIRADEVTSPLGKPF